MEPAIIVQKYGGSSLADAASIRRIAQRIVASREGGVGVCVVVSAMGRTTDTLFDLAQSVSESPSRRELDMLMSCGERASMALLSMALHELGCDAVSLTGSQAGILTNDRHAGARIIEVRPVRVEDELARGRVVIVAGFQGVSYKREITTLGRGGSDTTAVALAAALGAQYCEICSDVDGVYSADPRVVDSATLFEAISYDMMESLASRGARVLHPQAVAFARKAGVVLYARSSHGPPSVGTRISQPETAMTRVAIASDDGLVCVRCSHVAASDCQQILYRYEVSFRRLAIDENGGYEWVFAVCDVPDWRAVRDELRETGGQVVEGLGAVSVVREGDRLLRALPTITRLADTFFADATWRLYAEPTSVTLLCAQDQVAGLTERLHEHLTAEEPATDDSR